MNIKAGIITISDRAAAGAYEDMAGPALRKAVAQYGWTIGAQDIVADETRQIQSAIRQQIAAGCEVILTTGGTGVSLRDVTPEAVRELAARELPGFGELMRMKSAQLTPHAILSRSLAAVIDATLVICLPGKPSAAVECLGFVAAAVPHCVELQRLKPGQNCDNH